MRTRRALRGKRVSSGQRRMSGQHIKDWLEANRRAKATIARERLALEEAGPASESEAGVALSRVAPQSGRPPGEE